MANEWNNITFAQWSQECLKDAVCFGAEVKENRNLGDLWGNGEMYPFYGNSLVESGNADVNNRSLPLKQLA